MKLTTTPVRAATAHDEAACTVFRDDRLPAVLVRFSHQHEDVAVQ